MKEKAKIASILLYSGLGVVVLSVLGNMAFPDSLLFNQNLEKGHTGIVSLIGLVVFLSSFVVNVRFSLKPLMVSDFLIKLGIVGVILERAIGNIFPNLYFFVRSGSQISPAMFFFLGLIVAGVVFREIEDQDNEE